MTKQLYCSGHHNCIVQALHGFGGDGCDFSLVQAHSTLSWCCMDLLGHGRSPKSSFPSDYDVHAQVQQIRAQRKGSILLGYSMGARLALHTVLSTHDTWEALVLISGTAGLQKNRAQRKKWDRELAQRLLSSTNDEFWAYWKEVPIIASQKGIDSSFQKHRTERRKNVDRASLAASVLGFGAGVMPSVWERLYEIRVPVLLIVGEEDQKYSEIGHMLYKRLHNASLTVIPSVGHAPHLEAPEQVATAIDDWVSSLRR